MNKIWVKFNQFHATQVSSVGCENVDDFLKAVKRELSSKLGPYDTDQLTLSLTVGGPALEPDDNLPIQNTARTPLIVSVVEIAQGCQLPYHRYHCTYFNQLIP